MHRLGRTLFIWVVLILIPVYSALGFDVPIRTITVDGQPGDWAGISPILTDPSGDSTCGAGTDIIALYLARDDQYLYWRMDTADGQFSYDGQDTPRGPEVTFYSISGGQAVSGVSASLPGDPGVASISFLAPPSDWVHLATCPRWGKAVQVAEGKIPLNLFNGFTLNTLHTGYRSGVGAAFCDEAQLTEDLILALGPGPAAPVQIAPEDGYTTPATSVLLEWTGGNGTDEELEITKDGGLLLRERACGKKQLENLPCGTYYWKVRSCVGTDCFDWSPWRSLTVECPSEPTPTPTPEPEPEPACTLVLDTCNCISGDGYQVSSTWHWENDECYSIGITRSYNPGATSFFYEGEFSYTNFFGTYSAPFSIDIKCFNTSWELLCTQTCNPTCIEPE